MKYATLLLLLLGLTVSCNSSKKSMSAKSDSIEGHHWELVELMGQPIPANMKKPFLHLDSTTKTVTGNGGCNNFHGPYEINAETMRISFKNIASTMMACPDMTTENGLNSVLSTVDNYSLSGNTMTLNKARMAPLARFERKK